MENAESFINIVGKRITKIIYRGDNIFTVLLVDSAVEIRIGLNLVECFSLEDSGVIGGVIEAYEIGSLGMRDVFICQKRGIDHQDYHKVWIKVLSNNEKEGSELIAAVKDVEISENINLYNPISEDKY